MADACRQKTDRINCDEQDESFCVFNVLCVFISMVTILADLTTDILVFAEYCKNGYFYWALATLIFIFTPNVLINIFSIRWYLIDNSVKLQQWISHGCLVGLIERYVVFLRKVFFCHNSETKKLTSQRNDLSLLHFLYIFTGTIPQIILQSYAVITLDDNYHTKVFSLTASVVSLVWGCTTYTYSIMANANKNFQWISLILKLFSHFGMLIARITGILLFTVVFGIWILLPLGLHWTAMTFWIIVQNTTFCPNKLEETLYNVVMGFVYCFSYINLQEGHTRYRLMMFYTLIVTQNFGSLFLYVLVSEPNHHSKMWSTAATICIITGSVTGVAAITLYYRFFHSKGPIQWKNNSEDMELNNKITQTNKSHCSLHHVRSFKSQKNNIQNNEISNRNTQTQEIIPQTDIESIDKKFLLDHLIVRSGSPTFTAVPLGNASKDASSIELYTVENTPQSMEMHKKTKKITVCSPTELNLKLSSIEKLESSIDEITSSNLNLQKRRGICSSDELRHDLENLNLDMCNILSEGLKKLKSDHGSEISHDTEGSNKKTSSDSIDLDLDLSFSDINSSDINTFNENIVQKLCLSALKNIKVGNQDADIENIQRIALDILKEMYAKKDKSRYGNVCETFSPKQRDLDTPTEMLSVHDYENICAVNIAREAWGLRSWNGYCDIENWLHDGSVVRDRRRDTLTSASTEISSCISQELKNAIMAAPSFSKKTPTYCNVFIKSEKVNHEDYLNESLTSNDTFLAKPCMVDSVHNKDLSNLEPILEELDDLGDIDPSSKKRLNSESSLVATIDEIRKATVTNSPRNVYHRREQLWDSPRLEITSKLDINLKHALWKEPSKFNSINSMESLPEKENILRDHNSKYDFPKKGLNFSSTSSASDQNVPRSEIICTKNIERRQNSTGQTLKNINNKSDRQLHDLSNQDIDFLWQLVSENSRQCSSTEDLLSTRRTSSLQSLIHNEPAVSNVNVSSKITNIRKGGKTRPRRKFSILRERFEPKINLHSDEEILYKRSENRFNSNDSLVSIKSEIDPRVTDASSECKYSNKNGTKIQSKDTVMQNLSLGKEKRSLFINQHISQPKFNTKLRHKI